jgi:FkbM family methyltransferase
MSNFLTYFKRYLYNLKKGIKFFVALWPSIPQSVGKVNFLILNLENFLPIPAKFKVKLINITAYPLRNIIVKLYGCYFVAVDLESFSVLLPSHEPWIWRNLQLKRGDVFIDVGAHIGRYTLLLAKIVGKYGKVISIEPDPDNFRALIRGIELNGLDNVIPINAALWSEETFMPLYRGDVSEHRSLVGWRSNEYILVKATTLDKVLDELEIEKVDWVKIDVVGSELEVLNGMSATLVKYQPKIIAEVWKENESLFINSLKAKNYEVKVIYTTNRVTYLTATPTKKVLG